MPKHCIVKGCKSNLENGFRFPMDRPDAVRKWVLALEKHQEVPPDYENKVVCPAHFVEGDYLKSKKNQINKKAVPSVFPEIPQDYKSEDEDDKLPKVDIKQEPEENYTPGPGGKNLRRKRLTIPVTEPDSEEDVGSNYEPSESFEEMSFTDKDSEKMEQMDDDLEDDSRDNMGVDFHGSMSDVDVSKGNESTLTFMEIGNDEAVDSDYEPVTDTSFEVIQEKLNRKSEILEKEKNTLTSMEEMIKNQAATILKLEEELAELMKAEAEENKNDKTSGNPVNSGKAAANPTSKSVTASLTASKTTDYSNIDLQMFSISLYYFSPKTYAYLGSIMPYLPPKNIVIDWVKTGHAFMLFPPGVLLRENFVLE